MKRRFMALALGAALLATGLAGCARGSVGSSSSSGTTSTEAAGGEAAADSTEAAGSSTAQYNIRVGHVLANSHPYQTGLEKFAELVEEKTNGAVHVDAFSDSQLGNERDMIEGLQLGTIEMALVSTAPLSGFTSDFLVFDLPYIFPDSDTARSCVDSEVGQGMLDSLESQGIKGLVYFENGFRHVTNSSKEIVHPSDMAGVKIRTMENAIQMETFSVMGADPTPMAFGELFTALQQKTIDAQENPLPVIDTSKFYEVQPYLSLTGHFYAPAPLLIGKAFYDSLPEEYQTAVVESAKEARDFERGLLDEMNERLVNEFKEKGITITEVDKDEWREAVQPVYDKYIGEGTDMIPQDIYDKVEAFINK